jgi:hypothetical protein
LQGKNKRIEGIGRISANQSPLATGGESNWCGPSEEDIIATSDPAEALTGKTVA